VAEPELTEEDVVARVHSTLSLDTIQRYMEKPCKDCECDATILRACPNFMAMLNHLHYSLHVKVLNLFVWGPQHRKIVPCTNYGADKCEYFTMRSRARSEGYCEPCRKKHNLAQERDKRHKQALAKGVDHSSIHSKCGINKLSEDDTKKTFLRIDCGNEKGEK
jgi:hypothetical protein